ncbi:hypothetical protein TURU_088630 [Turdus rufiventris]|nr:hypothetical protein TURU_088630 [Turdus rufiventris]
MIPKYKLLMQFEIADGSDDSNVLGHFNPMALAMTLNVYVQVTDSHLKEVVLRHLKLEAIGGAITQKADTSAILSTLCPLHVRVGHKVFIAQGHLDSWNILDWKELLEVIYFNLTNASFSRVP